MAKTTGVIFAHLNGKALRLKDGTARLTMGGYMREPVRSGFQILYREEYTPGEFEATLIHGADTSIEDYRDIVGGELRAETDTGKVFLIKNASTRSIGPLAAGEGDLEISVFGDPAVEE